MREAHGLVCTLGIERATAVGWWTLHERYGILLPVYTHCHGTTYHLFSLAESLSGNTAYLYLIRATRRLDTVFCILHGTSNGDVGRTFDAAPLSVCKLARG